MAVQNLQRVAATGMLLMHSGQGRSAAAVFLVAMTVIRLAGTTTK